MEKKITKIIKKDLEALTCFFGNLEDQFPMSKVELNTIIEFLKQG